MRGCETVGRKVAISCHLPHFADFQNQYIVGGGREREFDCTRFKQWCITTVITALLYVTWTDYV